FQLHPRQNVFGQDHTERIADLSKFERGHDATFKVITVVILREKQALCKALSTLVAAFGLMRESSNTPDGGMNRRVFARPG
ncbi:MAG: hypothetical protein LBV44_09040, partial [Methylobacillus sp.]|nr:hypothetical protein [Methylobacillus sp.]